MLIILPPLFFIVLYNYLHSTRSPAGETRADWRESILMTSVLWGAILVVITEVLSFGSVLTRPLVAGSWAAVLVLLLRLGFQREIFRPAFVKFRPPHL